MRTQAVQGGGRGMNPRGRDQTLDAAFAALRQQVSSLDQEQAEIRGAILQLDKKIDRSFADSSSKIDAAFQAINEKIDKRSQTPWMAIWAGVSVLLTGITAIGATIGWLALQPTRDAVIRLDANIQAESDRRRYDDKSIEARIGSLQVSIAKIEGAREQFRFDITHPLPAR